MSIFIFRSVFVYSRCAERTLIRIKQGCCVTERVSEGFALQTNSCISCTAEAKVLFKVCLWAKILLSLANSTSRCSTQNLADLGSKATNRRRGSFPSGHDQRSRCQIFLNMHCLPASTLLVIYKKTLLSFVFN